MEHSQERGGLDRRQFISAAAAAAVAPALLGRTGAERRAAPIKVGVIGCGGRGTGAALDAMRADAGAVLWAMGDLFEDQLDACMSNLGEAIDEQAEEAANGEEPAGGRPDAASLRERTRVPPERRFAGFDAYQRVIDSGVDVVLLTTPPVFRPEHMRAAVAAGKHVFAEKPVAVDAPGVRVVLESARAAREQRLSVVSGFCWRYNARDRATIGRVKDGAIGPVRAIYTTYNVTGWHARKPRQPGWTEAEEHLRNWHYDSRLSGDHIVEQAVHMIDKINWIKGGAPARCTAVGGSQARDDGPEWCNVYDHFSVTYEYDDGTRAFHMCRHWPNTAWDNTDYIIGARGTCYVDPWSGRYEINAGGEPTWRPDVKRHNMYQQEHDELFAAIRAGEPMNDGEPMAHSTLMAIMGRTAAYTGRTISWEEAMESDESLAPREWEFGPFPAPPTPVPGRGRS